MPEHWGPAHEAWRCKGEYDKALSDYEESVRSGTDDLYLHRSFVIFLISCPNEHYRNAARAVEIANKACELGSWNYASDLAMLAAAHAEAGNYPEASAGAAKH